MRPAPSWEVEGRDWPNRAASRFVKNSGLHWHVQIMGAGPVMLLLHGTAAATHSWRGLMPLLAERFTIVAPDLPGHGFTESRAGLRPTLPLMAAAVTRLVAALDLPPVAIIGHSAGAAIGLRMVLDGMIAPQGVVSINGALAPFPGLAAVVFPALAKLLFVNPFAGPILARRAADPTAVRRLIAGTGSTLDARGLDLYGRLLGTQRHVEAALAMMANWDLRPLRQDLPRLTAPLTLVVADGDKAVLPKAAGESRALAPHARIVTVAGLGHLAHEEAPERFAEIILEACA